MNDSQSLEEITLADLIHAFKTARGHGNGADVRDFLPPHTHPLYAAARREILLADLELAWQAGERRLLLDYGAIFPDLFEDRATVEAAALAEYRLRLSAGEEPATAEYEWQYGVKTQGWPERTSQPAPPPVAPDEPKTELALAPDQLATRIVTPDQPATDGDAEPEVEGDRWLHQAMNTLPAVGTHFLTFELIAELGSGSFGRVYLARQGDLAHRLVALKITVDLPGEEQKLAQLQHTNVVPIYSFHQAGDLHAVCMPYFGATTLADIVRGLRGDATLPDSGKSLVNTVRTRCSVFFDKAGGAEPPAPAPAHVPKLADEEDVSVTLTMLEGASYVEAVLWLAERLTEGLSHAHERGILHRDLKPANILLTDDGQPMLLDFNLSADTKLGPGLQALRVGGTLPYMAPEHLASLQGGPSALDERSDVYALGVILYELLTGRLPFAATQKPTEPAIADMIAARTLPPPRLRPFNPAVSFGVESLVRKCLEGDVRRRYQSARQLREDLRRQRQNRPLRHAAEPSLRERMQKWARRHPRVVSPTTLGALTALVLALAVAPVSWQTWKKWEQHNADRDIALVKARSDAEIERANQRLRSDALAKYQRFRASAGAPRALMETVNVVQVLPKFMKAWTCEEARLTEGMAKCRAALEPYAVLSDADWSSQPMVQHLPDAEREQLHRDVSELLFALAQGELARAIHGAEQGRSYDPIPGALALIGSGLDVWGAWQATTNMPLRAAGELNEKARRCWPEEKTPRALLLQQADWLRLSGDAAEAKRIANVADAAPLAPATDDAYWTASALAANGDFHKALPLLSQAVRESPDHYGAWMLWGLCLTPRISVVSLNADQAARQKAFECFTTCIVMRPNDLWAYYNRGLVSYHLNLNDNALADFDRLLQKEVLAQQPAYGTAYVLRAAVLRSMKEYALADRDLSAAIAREPDVSQYYFLRAQVRAIRGRTAEAERDEQKFLALTPTTAEIWTYRGMVRAAKDPLGALADLDQALAIEPDEVLPLFLKGRLLVNVLKRPKEALPVFDRALAIKPDYVEARMMRGLTYAALGERSAAVKDADAALESEPSPAMHYHAARVYALTSPGHPPDAPHAIHLLRKALRNGYGVKIYQEDPDLAPLQKMPDFEQLPIGLKILGVPP